jgi:hypothetical protein
MCSGLFGILGKLLRDILPIAYPDTYGNRTMKQILKSIHRLLRDRRSNPDSRTVFGNSDLKGFFTSVPHDCIIEAVDHLLVKYVTNHPAGHRAVDIVFTIPQRYKSKARIIRGRSFTRSQKNRVIPLCDISLLVREALKMAFFQCMDTVYKQNRGAIIGGHASPAICSLAVAYREFVWQKAYSICVSSSSFMCIRYVDNRGTFYDPELQRLASFRRFLSPLFYEFPIELEDCGNDVFLGYKIDLNTNECTWIVPEEPHAYRSVNSAGTISRLLTGL